MKERKKEKEKQTSKENRRRIVKRNLAGKRLYEICRKIVRDKKRMC